LQVREENHYGELTLSLWNGFKKLPAISPSSRGVPGGLFMPAMLLGEFYTNKQRKKSRFTRQVFPLSSAISRDWMSS
jgi:hypothetical protein